MLWELMKAQRTGVYPDLRTKYIAEAFKNTSSKITEMSGALPLAFVTTGLPLTNYKPYGNAVQAATPSPDNPVAVQAVGDRTANLFSFSATEQNGTNDWIKCNGSESKFYITKSVMSVDISRGLSVNIKLAAGTYTLSVRGLIQYNQDYDRIYLKKSGGGNIALGTQTEDARTFTLTEETIISKMYCVMHAETVYENTEVCVMLNEGKTALPYEPYGYKIPFTTAAEDGSESITTTVYLDKPLYKIDDYADTLSYAEQKADRVIKELILTGEEEWLLQSINEHGIANYFIRFNNAHKVAFKMVCTHFVEQNTMIASTTTEGVFNANGNALYIRVKQERASTATNFKAYLAAQHNNGTPVKVWYVLATPESESVELPKLPTLDGVTVIDAATEIKPSKMDIKYTEQRLMMFARRD